MAQATIDGTVIAQTDDAVVIEGNQYFPPASISDGVLAESETAYHCPWKGDAQYFHAAVDGQTYEDAAWSYPTPPEAATERVGEDFAAYVAFDETQVTVSS